MARKVGFDKQQKLEQAMALFWRKGFANTSINDLVTELEINRFSLYNSFGDKETLYYLALDHYLNTVSLPKLQSLRDPKSDLATLQRFLQQFAAMQKQSLNGCLIQNAIIEHGGQDTTVQNKSDQLYDTLLEAMMIPLQHARQNNQLIAKANIATIAQFILCQLQGIRVLGKARRYADIDASLTMTLAALQTFAIESHA
ncbi:TetR/AcrR family transcriptional regulator [Vibrio hippocampi]|uniref:HTH tetR-type domain-containing protein n=1 Tax=Vibrio hippocampi TaxID=654686 RepID=A0ABN8DI64_9VIBR|nr:TetR/AcrR family transcriptional regulator [Vibrio hippocampi]CAH0525464.1 hypothetical protein VHP8226_00988 [Vibrio hippocampi]